ncbi:MAG TPA: PQQ-binding-like beta-propeller repeat protein, partial [Planctomycetota bacterium]|nr:PQQ-binding-like beta-propeller repeat protein [Planctomycetota bacterium]
LPQHGNGSPIVSNGRVFVTSAEDVDGARRSLYCFDRKDGKQVWVRTLNLGKREITHQTNPYCGTTPAADGKRVVVWEGSAGLHCYDFEGKELWKRDFGEFRHMWGYGTSPVIHDGKVLLNSGPGARVFVTALSLSDGKTIWENAEPSKGNNDNNEGGKPKGSWSTPLVVKNQVLCSMPTRVVAYGAADGKLLWTCDGLRFDKGDLAYSSPVLAGDILMATGGYNGPRMGLRLGGAPLWRIDSKSNPQSIGSGVAIDGLIYQPFEGGTNSIDCIDPRTGKLVWREERAGEGFWGSMVVAAGRAYVTDKKGTTVVFKPNPQKFELVARNELKEESNSTPAVSDGRIFIRTFKALYCIGE